jgi:hypothetical protein
MQHNHQPEKSLDQRPSWIHDSWFTLTIEDNRHYEEESCCTGADGQHFPSVPTDSPSPLTTANRSVATQEFCKLSLFPVKLHRCLEDAPRKGFDEIISWHSDGRRFRVHDRKRFEESIIPAYFGEHVKYRSFQRQLNVYGILRYASGVDVGYYEHPRMQQGRSDLCRTMHLEKNTKGILAKNVVNHVDSTTKGRRQTWNDNDSSLMRMDSGHAPKETDSRDGDDNRQRGGDQQKATVFGRQFYLVNLHAQRQAIL